MNYLNVAFHFIASSDYGEVSLGIAMLGFPFMAVCALAAVIADALFAEG
jgi:hypothetical protein